MNENGFGALPRVTTILQSAGLRGRFGFLDAERRLDVLARGRAFHLAAAYHAEALAAGIADVLISEWEDALHPIIKPFWAGYRRFLDDTGHVAVASELELIHPWGYVAHPDRVGMLGGLARVLIDFKSGSGPNADEVSLQLAAYRLAWDATHLDDPIERCVALVLDGEGGYRLMERDARGAELGGAWALQTFTAALLVYQARARMGR